MKQALTILFLMLLVISCKKEEEPVDTNPFNNLILCDPSGFPDWNYDCQLQAIHFNIWTGSVSTDSFAYDQQGRLVSRFLLSNGKQDNTYFDYEYHDDCSAIRKYYVNDLAGIYTLQGKLVYANKRLHYIAEYDGNGVAFNEMVFQYEQDLLTGIFTRRSGKIHYTAITLDERSNITKTQPMQLQHQAIPTQGETTYEYNSILNPQYLLPAFHSDAIYFSQNVISKINDHKWGHSVSNTRGFLAVMYDTFPDGRVNNHTYNYNCP